jgi:hypothetical protein
VRALPETRRVPPRVSKTRQGGTVKNCRAVRAKVAVTDFAASRVTLQTPVPVHAPPQATNTEPAPALGESPTMVPALKAAEQVEREGGRASAGNDLARKAGAAQRAARRLLGLTGLCQA